MGCRFRWRSCTACKKDRGWLYSSCRSVQSAGLLGTRGSSWTDFCFWFRIDLYEFPQIVISVVWFVFILPRQASAVGGPLFSPVRTKFFPISKNVPQHRITNMTYVMSWFFKSRAVYISSVLNFKKTQRVIKCECKGNTFNCPSPSSGSVFSLECDQGVPGL